MKFALFNSSHDDTFKVQWFFDFAELSNIAW